MDPTSIRGFTAAPTAAAASSSGGTDAIDELLQGVAKINIGKKPKKYQARLAIAPPRRKILSKMGDGAVHARRNIIPRNPSTFLEIRVMIAVKNALATAGINPVMENAGPMDITSLAGRSRTLLRYLKAAKTQLTRLESLSLSHLSIEYLTGPMQCYLMSYLRRVPSLTITKESFEKLYPEAKAKYLSKFTVT